MKSTQAHTKSSASLITSLLQGTKTQFSLYGTSKSRTE